MWHYFVFSNVKNKFGADTFSTDNIDVLTMCVDDFFDNCQTETGAFLVSATGSVDFVKNVPIFYECLLLGFRFRDL